MNLYNRIKDLRTDIDKTQEKFAKELNMHKTTYVRYENGDREPPFEFIIKLADYYNVSIDYIAGRSKNKKGLTKSELPDDVSQLVENFMFLSDRRKGQIDLLMKQLVEEQENENAQIKDVI